MICTKKGLDLSTLIRTYEGSEAYLDEGIPAVHIWWSVQCELSELDATRHAA